MYIALNYTRTLCIEVAHINYFTGSLNIYISKTLVFSFSAPSNHLFIDGKP